MQTFHIQPVTAAHRGQIIQFLAQRWGGSLVVSRGRQHDASALPGFIAKCDGRIVGLATYHLSGNACELVTLDSAIEGMGIGSKLVTAVKETAVAARCCRLWLITTNDNLHALGFYQKRGFRLIAVHPNALATSRQIKPQLPLIGLNGIFLRDEIELEMRLTTP